MRRESSDDSLPLLHAPRRPSEGVTDMPSNPISLESGFVPDEPIDPQGAAFFEQVTEMLDGQPKDPAAVEAALSGWGELLEKIAAELYRLGSMLLGEGEEAIGLIERVVAN